MYLLYLSIYITVGLIVYALAIDAKYTKPSVKRITLYSFLGPFTLLFLLHEDWSRAAKEQAEEEYQKEQQVLKRIHQCYCNEDPHTHDII